jgi:hypothetical protein
MRLARMRAPAQLRSLWCPQHKNESMRRRARDFGNAGDGITLTGRECITPDVFVYDT